MALAGVGGGGVKILHWLEISNFKSYRSSGRIPLEHPSVLIGPNNCGKTTALQAIALWSTAVRTWQQESKDSKAKQRTGKPLESSGDPIRSCSQDASLLEEPEGFWA